MDHKAFIEANRQRFLDELLDWLRIPSISSDPNSKEAMTKAAEYLRNRLTEQGVDRVEIYPTAGHPIVYAEKITDPSKPTVSYTDIMMFSLQILLICGIRRHLSL